MATLKLTIETSSVDEAGLLLSEIRRLIETLEQEGTLENPKRLVLLMP